MYALVPGAQSRDKLIAACSSSGVSFVESLMYGVTRNLKVSSAKTLYILMPTTFLLFGYEINIYKKPSFFNFFLYLKSSLVTVFI